MDLSTMNLWQQILWYVAKFFLVVGCALLGVFVGSVARKRKNASLEQMAQEEPQDV